MFCFGFFGGVGGINQWGQPNVAAICLSMFNIKNNVTCLSLYYYCFYAHHVHMAAVEVILRCTELSFQYR